MGICQIYRQLWQNTYIIPRWKQLIHPTCFLVWVDLQILSVYFAWNSGASWTLTNACMTWMEILPHEEYKLTSDLNYYYLLVFQKLILHFSFNKLRVRIFQYLIFIIEKYLWFRALTVFDVDSSINRHITSIKLKIESKMHDYLMNIFHLMSIIFNH